MTLEDLLEEIVGEIREEHEVGDDVVHAADGSWLVRGRASLHDLGELLDAGLSHGDSATVGGLLVSLADRVPLPGEVIEHADHRFEVEQADRKRVILVRVSKRASHGAGEGEVAAEGTTAS